MKKIMVNGTASGNTFMVSNDVNITADVTAIITEDNEFNNDDPIKATAVTVVGNASDFGKQNDDGKVTGIYFDGHGDAKSKTAETFTAIITYTYTEKFMERP